MMIHMRKKPSIFNHHLWGLKCSNGVRKSNSLMLEHFFHQQNVIVEQQHSVSGSVLTRKRRVIITPKTTKRICQFQKLPTAALISQPNPSTHRPPRVNPRLRSRRVPVTKYNEPPRGACSLVAYIEQRHLRSWRCQEWLIKEEKRG